MFFVLQETKNSNLFNKNRAQEYAIFSIESSLNRYITTYRLYFLKEIVIVMYSKKMKAKGLKEDIWKSFFRKGATKLYFMFYFRVVIILFSTGLYKSAFSTYDFGKTSFSSFCVLVFRVSVSLGFNF